MDIGKKIRQLRKERGLSLENIAHDLGCTAASISRYELGQRKLTLQTLMNLASALGVSLTELLEEGAGE